MKKIYDIAVIGGGASGLAAAVSALNEGKKLNKKIELIVIEATNKCGKKLLATGNGRCNLTNEDIVSTNYHGDREELANLLEKYPTEAIKGFFREFGVLCSSDEEGRVYPRSKQASAVLSALISAVELLGGEIICDFPVKAIKKQGSFVITSSDGGSIEAKKCIIAAGSAASSKHSKGNNGYSVLENLGHSVIEPMPCLVPLISNDKCLKNLSGVRNSCKVVLLDEKTPIKEEYGEIQFTDKAISGICIFQLSIYAQEYFRNGKAQNLRVSVDFLPDLDEDYIASFITSYINKYPKIAIGDVLAGLVNLKIAREIPKICGLDGYKPSSSLNKNDILRIAEKLKSFTVKIQGTKGLEDAQVTSGGVSLKELKPSLESKTVDGLYLCGETLNIHGDCGGYNLHFAWSSGIEAGINSIK